MDLSMEYNVVNEAMNFKTFLIYSAGLKKNMDKLGFQTYGLLCLYLWQLDHNMLAFVGNIVGKISSCLAEFLKIF